jgi:hypothetical protein
MSLRVQSIAMTTAWLLTCMAPSAQAQSDRWEQQVRASLSRAAQMLSDRGYRPTPASFVGALFAGESEVRELFLPAGANVVVVGVCDDDCGGLGLVVSNRTGYELAADRGVGNVPLVRVTPETAGMYRVKVSMQSCRISPCRYGIAVWRKG